MANTRYINWDTKAMTVGKPIAIGNTSGTQGLTDAELAALGVYVLVEDRPALDGTNKLSETFTDSLTNNVVTRTFTSITLTQAELDELAALLIPESVSMAQAREALIRAGLIDSVNSAVASMTEEAGLIAQNAWEYNTSVRRDSALIAALTPALGLSSAQVDALFITAEGL